MCSGEATSNFKIGIQCLEKSSPWTITLIEIIIHKSVETYKKNAIWKNNVLITVFFEKIYNIKLQLNIRVCIKKNCLWGGAY